MTDERFDEPDFDDPSYAGLQDLLSSAKVDGPIPAEVAARLDAALGELTGRPGVDTEPPVPDEDEPVVVPLRSRSRRASRLLAAAAVVVVAGAGAVGLNQVLTDDGSSDRSSPSANSAATSHAGGAVSAATPAVPTAPQKRLSALNGGQLGSARTLGGVPVLTTASFSRQVTGLGVIKAELSRGSRADAATTEGAPGTPQTAKRSTPAPAVPPADEDALAGSASAAPSCAGPGIAGTRSSPVVLDGQPAVLVVHPANAGTRLVEAWSCDGSRVLVFTTLPA